MVGDIPAARPAHISVSCEAWFQEVEEIRQTVQKKITALHEAARLRFLKDHPPPVFSKGDKVWVRNSRQRTKSNKLDPLWLGPCKILQRIVSSGRYKVSMPKGVEDVHSDDFKPYLAPPDGKAIPQWYFKPQPALPENDECVVEKIVDYRVEWGAFLAGALERVWPGGRHVGTSQQFC